MSDATKRLSDGFEAATDAAAEAGQDVASSVAKGGRRVRDAVREAASESGRAIGDAYSAVADKASESYRLGRDKAYELEGSLEELIRARPILSLAVAVGLSFAAGFLCRSTPERRRR